MVNNQPNKVTSKSIKKSSRKTTIRPSPSAHASDQNLGTIKTGNDKNKWIVIENIDKVKKWHRLYGKIQKYETHDNGARPFYVVISDKCIIVYKATDLYAEKTLRRKMFNGEVEFEPWSACMTISKYKNVFIGKHVKKYSCCKNYGSFAGNSILVETKPLHYIFIGDKIVEFETSEKITEYFSVMGNNNVPYPFAISQNYVYLMLDMVYMERVEGDPDPYQSFYGYANEYSSKPKKLSSKVLLKRWI